MVKTARRAIVACRARRIPDAKKPDKNKRISVPPQSEGDNQLRIAVTMQIDWEPQVTSRDIPDTFTIPSRAVVDRIAIVP